MSLAEPGISLFNPDVYPLDVLSSILNSFGGALFDTLRSREGLAYSVSGGWDTPLDHQVSKGGGVNRYTPEHPRYTPMHGSTY